MNFNEHQKEAIETTASKVIVMCAAASGKTSTITGRVLYLLKQGVNPKDIIVITFTNAAADEMASRIKNNEVFIGTVHSYALRLLTKKGINMDKYIQEEKFEVFFEKLSQHPNCIEHISHLIVDEVQDSGEDQFKFFAQINPDNFFYCGDIRQSIYGWANARPDLLLNLMRRPGTKIYELDQNYRNAPEILDFARNIIYRLGRDFFDDSEPMAQYSGRVMKASYSPEMVLKALNVIGGNPGDWFIVCRTNAQVDEVMALLEKNKMPCSTFKRGKLTSEEFRAEMEKDTIKVLTIHQSKGLESKNVIAVVGRAYNDEETRLQYVAATRAKEVLIWMTPAVTKRKTTGPRQRW